MACDDVISARPGQNHNRSVDYVGGTGCAAEFSARAGEFFLERNNRDFVKPQEPCRCDLNTGIAPGLPYHA